MIKVYCGKEPIWENGCHQADTLKEVIAFYEAALATRFPKRWVYEEGKLIGTIENKAFTPTPTDKQLYVFVYHNRKEPSELVRSMGGPITSSTTTECESLNHAIQLAESVIGQSATCDVLILQLDPSRVRYTRLDPQALKLVATVTSAKVTRY